MISKKYGDNNNQKRGTKKWSGITNAGNISGTSISCENFGGNKVGKTILKIEKSVKITDVITFPFFLNNNEITIENPTSRNEMKVKMAGIFHRGKYLEKSNNW